MSFLYRFGGKSGTWKRTLEERAGLQEGAWFLSLHYILVYGGGCRESEKSPKGRDRSFKEQFGKLKKEGETL